MIMQRTPKFLPISVFPGMIGAYILMRTVSIVNAFRVKATPVSRPPCGSGLAQTPPDLVVKSQPVDIVDVILWLVLRLRVVYPREIGG
jgi:hypothetical protein